MELLENGTEYLKDFIRLNEDWISRYFKLEESDHRLAENPFRIVEEGGYIFTLVDEGEVLGVCALFYHGQGVYELARMAVEPRHHGKGLSHRLMIAVMDKLDKLAASQVFLYSNTMLDSAISLYRKYGFETVSTGKHENYSRANIKMQKLLAG